MYSADEVSAKLEGLKNSGVELQDVAWQLALLCVGWAYVFGARGELCTPSNRRAKYKDDHPTIMTACNNYSGGGSCAGCKWFPNNSRTRFFDCRGFTYWVLLQVYGWKLNGTGATSQWNDESNWKAKGEIATMPKDKLCCVFVADGKKMAHTGLAYNKETIECSSGVQHFTTINKKWTHWAVPACVDGTVTPTPAPNPTLRRGNTGVYVTLLQTMLIQNGYDCGTSGIDGSFGKGTEAAVKAYQLDHTDADGNPLTVDGVVGAKTWWALETTQTAFYTVMIPHLSKSQAAALCTQYPGSTITEERG